MEESSEKNKEITNMTFEEAFGELESIEKKLKSDEISIDDLAKEIERSSELTNYCKTKLRNTEERVKEIMEKAD